MSTVDLMKVASNFFKKQNVTDIQFEGEYTTTKSRLLKFHAFDNTIHRVYVFEVNQYNPEQVQIFKSIGKYKGGVYEQNG